MLARILLPLLFVQSLALPAAFGKERASTHFKLAQLIELAQKHYPGIKAARHAVAAMQAQAYRAKWAWLPQGTVTGLVAPSPNVRCDPDEDRCTRTTQDPSTIELSGILAQIRLEVGLPLYTFDKIGSAKRAARAGVSATKTQVRAAIEDLSLKVTKAYWGLKLARELVLTIEEGKKHIDKARDRIETQLDNEEGEVTVTDLLRLKTAAAEVDARHGEAKRLEALALAGLATLTGQKLGSFDIDTEQLLPLAGETQSLDRYLAIAKESRPEVELLKVAAQATQAGVDLEKAKFFPDFVLVGTLGYGKATGADDPHNGFLSDPYNFVSAGFGLALRWNLDTIQQVGRYRAAKAKAAQVSAKRQEGLAGIDLEIRKEWTGLREAIARMKITKKGQKAARSWLVATAQNLATGLAETKDLTDALLAFFQLKLRWLQAIFDVNLGWAKLGRAVGRKAQLVRK